MSRNLALFFAVGGLPQIMVATVPNEPGTVAANMPFKFTSTHVRIG